MEKYQEMANPAIAYTLLKSAYQDLKNYLEFTPGIYFTEMMVQIRVQAVLAWAVTYKLRGGKRDIDSYVNNCKEISKRYPNAEKEIFNHERTDRYIEEYSQANS